MNDATISSRVPFRQIVGLILWIALTFLASTTAFFVSTDGWYAVLNKPSWNPPGWAFGVVWPVLYAMMAVAAWLVWLEGGWKFRHQALKWYLLQWALNALWTPLFFGAHQIGWAFLEILLLWLSIGATALAFRSIKSIAALLLLPYLAWVTFAAFLNFTIWRMNS
jgi:tryptophan-rich sensory protein